MTAGTEKNLKAPLCAIIADLDGGIWVSQTRASSHVEAIGTWAKEFDIEPIEGFDREDRMSDITIEG